MKLTIKQKAEIAIDELNSAAMLMHRQMKSGELNQPAADKAISTAQRKAKDVQTAYFKRASPENINEQFQQMFEFDQSELFDEFKMVYDRFGRVLKHYSEAVGARFEVAA